MELGDSAHYAAGVGVVDVHCNDGDLIEAIIAVVAEGGEPVAVCVHEGWRDQGGLWVRNGEEGCEVLRRRNRVV